MVIMLLRWYVITTDGFHDALFVIKPDEFAFRNVVFDHLLSSHGFLIYLSVFVTEILTSTNWNFPVDVVTSALLS